MDFSLSELNFNSVETLPGFEARAAFTVNSATVFREDVDIVPTIVDDSLSYVPWGGDNQMPFNLLDLVEKDETLATCQCFNAEVCYGAGLRYDCSQSSAATRSAVDDFLLDNDLAAYFLGICQDFKHFGFAVSVLILNEDGTRIVRLLRKEACYCRFTPADAHGRISKILYANWRKAISSRNDIEEIDLLDPTSSWRDLQDKLAKKSKVRKFTIVSRIPTVDSTYYPIPYYGALFRGKWYNIKRGCPENIAIFGHINRADVAAKKVIFDCKIRDKGFYKFGSITITEINDAEVKTQFLEGRSEQNFDTTFDDVFFNELDLGSASGCNDSTPPNAWDPYLQSMKCVALPWVNDASGNIQNLADYHPEERNANGTLKTQAYYSWNADCRGRSWQPYLLYITKKICEAVRYSADFSKWEDKEEYKFLLICNTLPYAWDTGGFARALPHWTVAEYFEKLELFLGGEFTINHRIKTISFELTDEVLSTLKPIALNDIIEEYSTEVTVEDDRCEYSEAKNLVFKE